MVRRTPKSYTVKLGRARVKISKDDMKARNLALVMEYKIADASRRGAILQEYFELNRSFVTHFPRFHDDYREEIINTFVAMLPDFFMAYDPSKGSELNSYLAMFAKKNAIREFLYLLPTVQFNKRQKDKNGKVFFQKALVQPLDDLRGSQDDEDGDGNGIDVLLGKTVFRDFLKGGAVDAAGQFLPGSDSYAQHFEGLAAEIVRDFESGLRWQEVQRKSGLSPDRFMSMMMGIRMQLTRLMTDGGKSARIVNCRANRPIRSVRRRSATDLYGDWQGQGGVWPETEADNGVTPSDERGIQETQNEGPFFVEGDGPEGIGEGEGT